MQFRPQNRPLFFFLVLKNVFITRITYTLISCKLLRFTCSILHTLINYIYSGHFYWFPLRCEVNTYHIPGTYIQNFLLCFQEYPIFYRTWQFYILLRCNTSQCFYIYKLFFRASTGLKTSFKHRWRYVLFSDYHHKVRNIALGRTVC